MQRSGLTLLLRPWSALRSYHSVPRGLFGIQNLLQPEDFTRVTTTTLSRSKELILEIKQAAPTAAVVRLMDNLSDELCRAYDAAECCRNVHSNKDWRFAANQLCHSVGEYITEVNHDEGLYTKLKQTLDRYDQTPGATGEALTSVPPVPQLSRAELAEFTPELVMVGRKLLLDFEKSGIHLPPPKRARMQKLLNDNNHFAVLFKQNMVDLHQLGSVALTADELPPRWPRRRQLPLDDGTLHGFLAAAPSEAARKKVYTAGFTSPAANLCLLEGMIATRAEIAHLMGARSWAHYRALDSSLAGEPAAVAAFLRQLAGDVKPLADKEVQALARMKAVEQGGRGTLRLEAWDVDYYKAAAVQQARLLDGWQHKVADYLHLDSIFAGLQELLGQLMGLKLELQQASPQEAWAPEVRKLSVSCSRDGPLGTILLDFVTRPDKHPGSVLFPVRCGRRLASGEYQQPILVLATDFGSHPWHTPLTWRQLRALLHELGHAVHNLVSRTEFQHLWGTRCAQDIVEVPSHLMELMATDPRSAALLARHRTSREPLPAAALQQINQHNAMFPALELQDQVLHALVDAEYFGAAQPAPGSTSTMWEELAGSFSSVPHVSGTSPQARFSHLTVYGGCYYGYTFARCLSAQIWAQFLADDPLDPEAGHTIRTKLLAPGGTVEPLDLFSHLLGPSALQHLHGGWVPSTQHLLAAPGWRS